MNSEILSKLVITKVHSVSNMYSPQNKKAKRKDRQRWAILLKYEGETVYNSSGKNFLSDGNHIVMLPKSCSYDWLCTKAGHFFIIEFDSDLTYAEPISFFVKNGEKILKMFKELEQKRNLKDPMIEFESIRDTYSIILALTQSETEQYLPTEKQQKIAPALEYISQHYNENITNDQLAAIAGMSTVYFRKLFSNVFGQSPMRYLQMLRMEKAKDMLSGDYVPISDVSESVGFKSIYHFSKTFKKTTGYTPTEYAKRKNR